MEKVLGAEVLFGAGDPLSWWEALEVLVKFEETEIVGKDTRHTEEDGVEETD